MKTFISLLPLASLAFALGQDQCGPQPTITKTEIQKVTVTVKPSTNPATPSVAREDVTHIKPSQVPSSKPHFPHYPFPNGTHSHHGPTGTHTRHRPTTLETYASPSSAVAAISSSSSSSKSKVTVVVSPSPVNSQEAIPTSESAASAVASSTTSSAVAEASTSPVETVNNAAGVSGTATFYGGNVGGGACSFSGYTIPSGLFGTAFGGNWDASQCGACVSVTSPNGNSVKAMIVDQCPECTTSHLDLFQNAFASLADISKGVIDISYSVVPCDITSPIILKNKEGTSPYWFSMQVMNTNVAISKLEVSTDSGSSWKSTTRQDYNFFEISSGTGTDTVDVRVTSVGGESIVIKSVSVAAGSTKTASSNFS